MLVDLKKVIYKYNNMTKVYLIVQNLMKYYQFIYLYIIYIVLKHNLGKKQNLWTTDPCFYLLNFSIKFGTKGTLRESRVDYNMIK